MADQTFTVHKTCDLCNMPRARFVVDREPTGHIFIIGGNPYNFNGKRVCLECYNSTRARHGLPPS